MKHLLKLEAWSTEEIINTLNLADQLKYEQKHGIEHKILKGKSLGMIFEKSSTRIDNLQQKRVPDYRVTAS